MNRNFTKVALALSVALLSTPQVNAGVFSKMKEAAQKAAQKASEVAKNKDVQQALKGAGKSIAGALKGSAQ